jgi:hypothetical protein
MEQPHASEALLNQVIDASADRYHNALLRELVRGCDGKTGYGSPQRLDRSEINALLEFLDRSPGAEVVQQSKPGTVPTSDACRMAK